VVIRDARPADAEGVADLLAELGYPGEPNEVARRLGRLASDPGSRVLVADGQPELLGLASLTVLPLLHEDGCWVRISAFVVTEASRRRGVGRAFWTPPKRKRGGVAAGTPR
jgi:hypothetical protein